MKKMFFYANFRSYDQTLGITRKVYNEIKAFRKLGYEVTYTGYLSDGVAIFNNEGDIIKKRRYPISNSTIQHAIRRGMLMKLCKDYVTETEKKYDFAYARYHFFDEKYLSMLKALKRYASKVIIEAHSTPKFSSKISYMYFVGIKDKIWGKFAHNYVDGIASMSDESELWGIKTFKISNAIDIESIRMHNYCGEANDINFISVSYERDVHGYDRLIRGLDKYYKNGGKREVYFHMVGSSLDSTIKLIEKLNLKNRCFIYGPMSGSDLDLVYDKANIGVGCLANHRIGSFFGSALKTKEYIAKGIPFIYGWKEKVLENFEFAKEYELCEDPIDIESVIKFYDSLDKDNLSDRIRACLGIEDTWEYQMKIVVANTN